MCMATSAATRTVQKAWSQTRSNNLKMTHAPHEVGAINGRNVVHDSQAELPVVEDGLPAAAAVVEEARPQLHPQLGHLHSDGSVCSEHSELCLDKPSQAGYLCGNIVIGLWQALYRLTFLSTLQQQPQIPAEHA